MNKEEAYHYMREAFDRLEEDEKENLRFHAKRRTPILCGKWAAWWTDGDGAG